MFPWRWTISSFDNIFIIKARRFQSRSFTCNVLPLGIVSTPLFENQKLARDWHALLRLAFPVSRSIKNDTRHVSVHRVRRPFC